MQDGLPVFRTLVEAIQYEELGEYAKAYEVWTQLADGLEQRGFESEVTLPRSQAHKCREKIST